MSPTEGQPERERMRKLEDAAAENLEDYVRAYGRVAPQLDAQCIRIASGVAAFTGIGSPLTTVKGVGAHSSVRDLDEIEAFFSDHHAATVTIEMAPWASQETGMILGERGYALADQEDVMVRSSGGAPSGRAFRAEAMPVQAWVQIMRRTSDLPDGSPTEALVAAAAQLSTAQLFGVREDGRWTACAQSVTYDDVVIFGNDGTLPEARRQGAQTALIGERLAALPAGKIVMAEVAPGSGSERNYLRCGFEIAYARSQYAKAVD
jgi:hypothetical protein